MPPTVLAELPRDTTVYVMNGNYLPEIKREMQGRFACLAIDCLAASQAEGSSV
jgi:hypothetical protein